MSGNQSPRQVSVHLHSCSGTEWQRQKLTKWNRETFQTVSILDPDAIARVLHPESGSSALDAGRAVLSMAKGLLEQRQSFLVETTLSGNTYLRMMKEARQLGYHVVLLFVGTTSLMSIYGV